MPSLFGNLTKENSISNQIIANDMLAGSKAAAQAYLNAAIESSTPELKNLYINSITQILQGQQAASEMAIKKEWYKPYQSPEQQLQDTFHFSEAMTQER